MSLSHATTLWYARIGDRHGLTVQVGLIGLFFPCENSSVWIANPHDITITSAVPPLLDAHLRASVERKLMALWEGRS